jgi:DNA-binding transcriptional MerR regulator
MANPGSGRHRIFSDDDLRVFSLVNEMKNKGLTYSDIHASLKAGQIGDLPEIPVESEVVEEIAIAQTQHKLAQLAAERDKAIQKLHDAEGEIIRLETELKNARKAEERLEEARERIEDLVKQVAKLEVRLEIEKERRDTE